MINGAEFRIIGMFPKRFAKESIEAPDGFQVIGVTHGVSAAFGNGDGGKARAYGGAPENRWSVRRPMGA